MLAFLLTWSVESKAQTYSAWGVGTSGAYDEYTTYNDTMRITFSGIPAGVIGMAKLVVYYEGDFGDNIEDSENYLAATPTGNNISMLGINGPFPSGMDCSPEDSTVFMFSSGLISGLTSFSIKNIPNNNCDPGVCTVVRVRMRIELEVCPTGIPVPATMAVSNDSICPGTNVTLTGTPSGGTFSGTGVSGSTFNSASLPGGLYIINYTGTDPGTGCQVSTKDTIRVLASPALTDMTVCAGDMVDVDGGSVLVFYQDAGLTMPIDTTDVLMGYGPVNSDQTLYAQYAGGDYLFDITSITDANIELIDDTWDIISDDRGGIAVTPNYIYEGGDAGTARYDVNMDPLTGILLPIRDGMFSDLGTGKLYTLYNSSMASDPQFAPGFFTVDQLMEMDDMMEFTGNTVNLSTPVDMEYDDILFAGAGMVIIYEYYDDNFVVINTQSGLVTNLGPAPAFFDAYYTETWIRWGVATYDGTDYSIVYRNNYSEEITKMNLTTGVQTTMMAFSSLGDMASITYSPWESKWYWKYEYGGDLGGFDEIIGKCDGSHTMVVEDVVAYGCPADVMLEVPSVDLGVDQTVCFGEEAEFFIGLGYSSITWNGVNNDQNTYGTTTGGNVFVEVVDAASGCVAKDTALVTQYGLPVVNLNLFDNDVCNGTTTFPLLGASPAGGTFSGPFVTGTNFNPWAAGDGIHIVTYTYTDANGCTNSDQAGIIVRTCLGVDELENNVISVYPNPAQSSIIIDGGAFVNQLTSIEVYDAQGKMVLSEKTTLAANQVLDLSNLQNGIYHVALTADGNRSMTRLVIQK